jgi:hypothetical protein
VTTATAARIVTSAGPPVRVSGGPLGAVQLADREIGRQSALRARAVVEFARSRPSSVDRQSGEPGCASAASRAARPEILEPVSEWAALELTVALSMSHTAATTLLEESLVLVHRLPATLDALQAGVLTPRHLRPFIERVGAITDPAVRATVESQLLRWMTGQVKTPAQLTEKARRLVLRHDARGAAERLAQAIRQRGVFAAPGREDGMSALTAVLSTPEARACLHVLGQYADAIADDAPSGDGVERPPRTRAEKMADCLVDLILRPGETYRPVVQAQLTVVASVQTLMGGDQPGEVDGQVVPAEVVRQLARALDLVPDDSAGDLPPASEPVADAPPTAWSAPAWTEPDARSGHPAAPQREWADFDPGEWPVESPPDDVQRARWAQDAAWEAWFAAECAIDPALPPAPGAAATDRPGTPPATGTWASADAAIAAATDVVEGARRALTHATHEVAAAERRADQDETAWQSSTAGQVTRASDSISALAHANAEQRKAIGELLVRSGGGGLSDHPRIAVVDALSGTLVALTGAAELRRTAHCGRPACARRRRPCIHDLRGRPGLSAPAATPGYRPGAELDRFVRARDRRCRFPGCRGRVPWGGELDHDRRWPDGPTSATNLAGYCTRNHRGKHQAPGWRHHLHPDGRLTVSTPTGLTATTWPSGYGFATEPITRSGQAEAAGTSRSAEPAPF